MLKYLTMLATVKCCHGAQVKIQSGLTNVKLDGAEVVARDAIIGATIMGCPNVGPGLTPCTAVVSVLAGFSPGVEIDGVTPLLETAMGLTNGVPPGIWKVEDPGAVKLAEGAAAATGATSPVAPEATPHSDMQRTRARNLKWAASEKRIGETVTLSWTPGEGDGHTARVTIFEKLLEGERVVCDLNCQWADGDSPHLDWEISYPFSGCPDRRPYAEYMFTVSGLVETIRSDQFVDGVLKVKGDVRCVITDSHNQPLFDQSCEVRAADGTKEFLKTKSGGVLKINGVHPAPTALFISGTQIQISGTGTSLQRSGALTPATFDRAESLLQRAAVRLNDHPRFEAVAARPVSEALIRVREERVDWSNTKTASAGALATTGLLLADDVTGVGVVDDVLIPVAWLIVLGVGLCEGLAQLAHLPWQRTATKQHFQDFHEILQSNPSAPKPESESESEPTLVDPITPLLTLYVISENSKSRKRERKTVDLFWPEFYLPRPAGIQQGEIVSRIRGKTATIRGTATCQRQVQTLIRFADREASRTGIPLRQLLTTRRFELIDAVKFAKKHPRNYFHPNLLYTKSDQQLLENIQRLNENALHVPLAEVAYDRFYGITDDYVGGGYYTKFDAHHTLPLYFQGAQESFANLCILDVDAHLRGHVLLRYQRHWGKHRLPVDILRHPPGQLYRIRFVSRESQVITRTPDEMEPDAIETDYWPRPEAEE